MTLDARAQDERRADAPGPSRWRAAQVVLALLMLLVLGGTLLGAGIAGYLPGAAPSGFTELYLLDLGGGTGSLPRRTTVGEAVTVIVGVANLEAAGRYYLLETRQNGRLLTRAWLFHLESRERWEEPIQFTPAEAGPNERIEFLLFVDGQAEPYRSTYLLMNVAPGVAAAVVKGGSPD